MCMSVCEREIRDVHVREKRQDFHPNDNRFQWRQAKPNAHRRNPIDFTPSPSQVSLLFSSHHHQPSQVLLQRLRSRLGWHLKNLHWTHEPQVTIPRIWPHLSPNPHHRCRVRPHLNHDHILMRSDRGFLYMSSLDIKLAIMHWFIAFVECKIGLPVAWHAVVLMAAKITAKQAIELGIIDLAHDSVDETVDSAMRLGKELVRRG